MVSGYEPQHDELLQCLGYPIVVSETRNQSERSSDVGIGSSVGQSTISTDGYRVQTLELIPRRGALVGGITVLMVRYMYSTVVRPVEARYTLIG